MRKRKNELFMVLACAGALGACFWWMRAKHEPMYEGRPVREWVREALDYEHWTSTTNARHIVSTRLKGQAVPRLSRELRDWCYPRWYYSAYGLQRHLPKRLWLLPEPRESRGAIAAAAWIVFEMEEAGAPLYGPLARCLHGANLHLWEYLEVMDLLIQAGPVAKAALPTLRRFAADPRSDFSVQAALAIYNTEGTTNALAQNLNRALAKPGAFSSFEREIWWFRGDDTVQGILLPMICPLVLDPTRPLSERKSIAVHLGELITSNPLPRRTLEALLDSAPEPELAEVARETLGNLDRRRDPLESTGGAAAGAGR